VSLGVPTSVLAHPLTESGGLPVSPALAVVLAVVGAVGLTMYWPARPRASDVEVPSAIDSWEGRLGLGQVVTRSVAFALLVLAVVAGRIGAEGELRNIAAPLVVGAAWPAIIVLSATLGPVWRWLDPWDGAARPVGGRAEDGTGGESGDAPPRVLLAVVPALLWVWYLGVYSTPLQPRSVGLALALYTLATVGACLAVGRVRWLSRVEVFGLFFGWLARLPRGWLGSWSPPSGTEVVLGVLAGGLLFGAIRKTDLWGGLNAVPGATLWATLGLLGTCLLFAGVLWGVGRAAIEAAPGSVARAAIPMVGAIAVAIGMARSRVFTSMTLLPSLASDPFGLGWDLFGTAGDPPDPPLLEPRLALVQLAVLVAGLLAGTFVLARLEPKARTWGAIALTVLMAGGVLAVMLAPGV
jgi:hypothetical protein